MIAVRFAARLLLGAMVPAFFLAAWAIEFAPTCNNAMPNLSAGLGSRSSLPRNAQIAENNGASNKMKPELNDCVCAAVMATPPRFKIELRSAN